MILKITQNRQKEMENMAFFFCVSIGNSGIRGFLFHIVLRAGHDFIENSILNYFDMRNRCKKESQKICQNAKKYLETTSIFDSNFSLIGLITGERIFYHKCCRNI